MRIALFGFMLESNGFAAPADEAEFREKMWLEGEALLADARAVTCRDPGGIKGFVEVMDAAGPWEPVPLVLTGAGASGPVEDGFFRRYVARIEAGLRAAMPLDGVYMESHGAASGTAEPDPEGVLFAAVRAVVGPSVPIVSTLDLHANVSRAMVAETDALIAYVTNPHVDMRERGQEAGRAMLELLGGMRTAKAFVKLPLLPPSVALLSDRGPYGAAIAEAQAMQGDPAILNVSVLGNFSLGDSPKNGMSVIATSRGDQAAANAAARWIAARLWARRGELVARLTSIADATAMLREACADPSRPTLLFADVADNPGGGGRGNATDILRGFLEAGIDRTAFAIHYDPELATEAHVAGRGARFHARLNRAEANADSVAATGGADRCGVRLDPPPMHGACDAGASRDRLEGVARPGGEVARAFPRRVRRPVHGRANYRGGRAGPGYPGAATRALDVAAPADLAVGAGHRVGRAGGCRGVTSLGAGAKPMA